MRRKGGCFQRGTENDSWQKYQLMRGWRRSRPIRSEPPEDSDAEGQSGEHSGDTDAGRGAQMRHH